MLTHLVTLKNKQILKSTPKCTGSQCEEASFKKFSAIIDFMFARPSGMIFKGVVEENFVNHWHNTEMKFQFFWKIEPNGSM